MPLPMPHSGESQQDFVSRCMGSEVMMTDFSDATQRAAVCHAQWRKKNDLDDEAMERRVLEATHLRVVHPSDSLSPRLAGYAIVFNSLSENLGGFRERISPEAMDRTFRENVDLRALVDHNPQLVLGRISANTLRLKSDTRGLRVEIDPPNTSYARDLIESIERRDITSMSFGFRVPQKGDAWDEEDGMPVRTIHDMLIREVSVVSFPAYADTDIEVAHRSLDRWRAAKPYRPSLAMNRARQRQAEQ